MADADELEYEIAFDCAQHDAPVCKGYLLNQEGSSKALSNAEFIETAVSNGLRKVYVAHEIKVSRKILCYVTLSDIAKSYLVNKVYTLSMGENKVMAKFNFSLHRNRTELWETVCPLVIQF